MSEKETLDGRVKERENLFFSPLLHSIFFSLQTGEKKRKKEKRKKDFSFLYLSWFFLSAVQETAIYLSIF
jgi:hypothetical protein